VLHAGHVFCDAICPCSSSIAALTSHTVNARSTKLSPLRTNRSSGLSCDRQSSINSRNVSGPARRNHWVDHAQNAFRLLCGISESSLQLKIVNFRYLRLRMGVAHRAEQFIMRNQLIGPFAEIVENAIGLGRERDSRRSLPKTLIDRIEVEFSNLSHKAGIFRHSGANFVIRHCHVGMGTKFEINGIFLETRNERLECSTSLSYGHGTSRDIGPNSVALFLKDSKRKDLSFTERQRFLNGFYQPFSYSQTSTRCEIFRIGQQIARPSDCPAGSIKPNFTSETQLVKGRSFARI
jgi:hypothetical protein